VDEVCAEGGSGRDRAGRYRDVFSVSCVREGELPMARIGWVQLQWTVNVGGTNAENRVIGQV
jgi:hypothetical protein